MQGHMVTLYLIFSGTAKLFPRDVRNFTFPPGYRSVPVSPSPLPSPVIIHLLSSPVVLVGVLCSLIHLIGHLCFFFGGLSVQISAHILKGLFVFTLLSCCSFFINYGDKSFTTSVICKYFLPFCGLSFCLFFFLKHKGV